jgi:hypothetical protein
VISARKALLFLLILCFGPSAILLVVPLAKNLISGRPVFQSPYGPSAGEELVLGPSFDVVQILRRENLSNYQLSERLGSDIWSQRILEGAWPIKPQIVSAYVLSANSEDKLKNCQVIGRTVLVQLCVRF